MLDRLRQFSAAAAAQFDRRDIVGLVGLGLLAYGLALVYLPAAFIAPGAILTAVAVFGVRGGSAE